MLKAAAAAESGCTRSNNYMRIVEPSKHSASSSFIPILSSKFLNISSILHDDCNSIIVN